MVSPWASRIASSPGSSTSTSRAPCCSRNASSCLADLHHLGLGVLEPGAVDAQAQARQRRGARSRRRWSPSGAPGRPAPGRTPGSPARSRGRWRRAGRRGPRSSTGAGRRASLTRPKVGLRPTTPHRAEGMRIEPPPSAPMAIGTSPAATAAAEPAEDPPVACPGSQGLRTNPVIGFMPVTPRPISCMLALPTSSAPAARRRATTVASAPPAWPANTRAPAAGRRRGPVELVLDRHRHAVQQRQRLPRRQRSAEARACAARRPRRRRRTPAAADRALVVRSRMAAQHRLGHRLGVGCAPRGRRGVVGHARPGARRRAGWRRASQRLQRRPACTAARWRPRRRRPTASASGGRRAASQRPEAPAAPAASAARAPAARPRQPALQRGRQQAQRRARQPGRLHRGSVRRTCRAS